MTYLKFLLIVTTIGVAYCCDLGYVKGSNDTCLPYVTQYHGDCSEDVQCEWLGENHECKYVCRCKKGYRWYLGECKKYASLGESCSEDIDCYDGYNLQSLSCKSNKCSCSDGYYQREDIDCRKKATNINDTCALDIDCQVLDQNTVCHLGKCEVASKIFYEKDEEEIQETKFLYESSAQINCTTDDECTIPNSECFDKTGRCTCKKSYFFSDDKTKCIAELGVNVGCENDSDCPIKPGKCENGACYCRDYYFGDDGNRNCIKTMSQNNWNCLSKEWCYAFGSYVFCNLNESCTCSSTANYDKETMTCKKVSNDDSLCISDYDCKYITNGFCIEEMCGCKPGFVLQDNVCVAAAIGVPCDENTTCTMDHSVCPNGFCECEENYVPYNSIACYLKSDGLGDECEVDVQCSTGIIYSQCKNNTCICDENHTPYNGTCYLKADYGSYCNNRLECVISAASAMKDSVVCRKRECQCSTGFRREGDTCSSGHEVTGGVLIAVILLLKNVF